MHEGGDFLAAAVISHIIVRRRRGLLGPLIQIDLSACSP